MPGNLYQRGGIWWARVQVRGRDVRRSLRTRSKVEAKKRLRVVLDDIEQFRFSGHERVTWKRAVTEYTMAAPNNVKANSLKRYKVSLRQVRPWLDSKYLDEIDLRLIGRIARERGKQGATNTTVRRDITAVSNVLRFAVAQGWIHQNPARQWDRSIIREKRDPIILPTLDEIHELVEAAPGNFARMIRFAQYSGMRLDEIATMERGQVRGRVVDLWRTKTNRVRAVDLDDRAVGTLTGTPAHLTSTVVFWHDKDLGLPYRNASSRFGAIRARVNRQRQKRGEPPITFRFHDLRHWFAVDYLRRRAGSLYDLQKILGHSSIRTTEIYLDYLTIEEQEAAKGVGTKPGTHATVFEESREGKSA